MNINTVYRCSYYGNSIACPNECNSIQHATSAYEFYATNKIYEYDPFFCNRDGVLIDNDNKSICRINIDADIEHSLQSAIDYISKCKVRGEKGDPGVYKIDFACSLPDHKCSFEEKVDESCEDYKLYRSISGNAQELLNLISDTLFTINKGGDKVKGLALIEAYLEGFQMLMDALRYINPPANFGDKEEGR